MNISTVERNWKARTKHAVWAFLFLASYSVSMVAPFVPTTYADGLDEQSVTEQAPVTEEVPTTGTEEETVSQPVTTDEIAGDEASSSKIPAKSQPLIATPENLNGSGCYPESRCYPTHPKKGSITIVKDAQPDSKEDFWFKTIGLDFHYPQLFSLKDNGLYPNINKQKFSDLRSDETYTFTEFGKDWWTLDNIACKGATRSVVTTMLPGVSIRLKEGEDITCTFTNKAYALVNVKKVLVPSDDQGKFDLLVDGQVKAANIGNGGETGFVKVSVGNHDISELASQGTSLDNYSSKWECKGPFTVAPGTGPTITGTVQKGEKWTCTFTNTRLTGKVKVVKKVINDNGGKKTAKDFSFTNSSGTPQKFDADGEVLLDNLNVGSSFDIKEVEANQNGYETSYDGCSGIVTAETKVCTITNNDKPGTITVIKNVKDSKGHLSEDVTNWTWSYDGYKTKKSHISTGSSNKQEVNAGTYVISEDQKDGYHVIKSSCKSDDHTVIYGAEKGSFGNGYDRPSTSERVSVGLGENVTCEFTNERDTGSLTVHKKIGNKWDPQGWTWWLGDRWNDQDMGETETVGTGLYWFGENQKNGYKFESLNCEVNGKYVWVDQGVTSKIYIGKDKHVVCTFTNTYKGGGGGGHGGQLTVIKDAQPDSSQGFTFTVEPTSLVLSEQGVGETVSQTIAGSNTILNGSATHQTFTLTDNGTHDGKNVRTTSLVPGWYRVSEATLAGWDLSDISCGNAQVTKGEDGSVTVNIKSGSHITCTFTNTQRAQLTVVKDAETNSSHAFSFTSTLPDGVNENAAFSLTDDGTGTMNSKTFENLKPGTYTVTEKSDDSTWKLKDISCSGSGVTMSHEDSKLTVTLAAGAVATCTFVNTFVPQVLGSETTTPTLVNTGTDTIIGATIALLLTGVAIFVAMQRRMVTEVVQKN